MKKYLILLLLLLISYVSYSQCSGLSNNFSTVTVESDKSVKATMQLCYNDTIDFEIHVREGPQATFKNIRITGNERTKEYVIRRELRTLPGEKFSRSDVIRSQREIANLGFFDQEKITPNIVPNQEDGTVDITWSVAEKSSDQLELSAGFSKMD